MGFYEKDIYYIFYRNFNIININYFTWSKCIYVPISKEKPTIQNFEQFKKAAEKFGIKLISVEPIKTTEFYLGINLKVAKQIGINIPDDLLQQADDIIR